MKQRRKFKRIALVAGVILITFEECSVMLTNMNRNAAYEVLSAQPAVYAAKKNTDNKKKTIEWNEKWKYAKNSKIHSDSVALYQSNSKKRKNKVIAINAGHGTKGGTNVKTLCHPDGSPKVTGGSTGAGAKMAAAIAAGTTLHNGISEADANLNFALVLKKVLLENGYDVLMIRETKDTQIDNIARTVYANNNSDCHIAIHYDSTQSNKGAFYISVPNNKKYRSMEPITSNWKKHNTLGRALIHGIKSKGRKIYGSGSMAIDLTQTSYSTIPSVDLEIGDRASDYSKEELSKIAEGIKNGLNQFFK